MKNFFAIMFVFVMITSSFGEPVKDVTVDMALSGALNSNPSYLSAVEKRKGAMYTYIGSYYELLPRLDLGWDSYNSNSPMGFSRSEIYSAKASMNVFKGFISYANISSSSLNYDNFKYLEDEARLKVIKDVYLAYQNVLNTDYLLISAKTMLKSAELVLRESEVRKQLDIISKADYYKAQADREKAYSTMLDAEINHQSALLELENLTGLHFDNNAVFKPFIKNYELKPLNDYQELAMQNNRMLLRYMNDAEISKHSFRAALGTFLPSVDLSASSSWNIEGSKEYKDSKEYNNNRIGISISMNVFSGFADSATVLSNSKNLNSARLSVSQTRNDVRKEVEVLWLKAKTSKDKLRSAELYVEASQESYNAMQEMFSLGRASLKDTIDARATLEDAQASLANARYLMIQAYEELYFMTGGVN